MPEFRRLRWFLVIVAALITGEAVYSSPDLAGRAMAVRVLTSIIAFGIVCVAMFLFNRFCLWLLSAVSRKQNGLEGVLCEHTITIGPDGVVETTAVNEGRHSWRGIHRIDTTDEHIFISIQANQAHTIPRRAFSSPEEAALFYRTAKAYHQQAKAVQ